MAKVSIILDKRSADKQGRYPIRLRIVNGNTNTMIATNLNVSESDFVGDPEKAIVRTNANAKQGNAFIKELYYTFINAINELEHSGRLKAMSATDIRKYVEEKKECHTEYDFTSVMQEYYAKTRTDKTKDTFDFTKKKLQAFAEKEKFFFEEINYKFLTDFDRWMENNGVSMSSRGIIFRNIRTVYNYAINNDWVNAGLYPFRKFKIKQSHTEKVYLPEDKMRALMALDLTDEQQKGLDLARDLFMLSFYLCGINPIDLFNLPKQSGSIKFVRTKVKWHEPEPIHIRIQPEAQKIIDKHPGATHLTDFAEKYVSFDSFYHFCKHRLKKLGEMIDCPDITFYWARYSWATYASKLDIADSTISKALGHADGTLAEKRYISFDWSKVDAANRKVIVYVTKKGKKNTK